MKDMKKSAKKKEIWQVQCEVNDACAEVKKVAKAMPGSALAINQRGRS